MNRATTFLSKTARRLGAFLERLHERYSRTFWTLHSVWALITGAVVLVLAHNRYGFLPWVIFFLALTWASTLLFSRFSRPSRSRAFRLAQGFVSYLTRVMYQETLFFLIPFYSYSATFPSANSLFVAVLALLALLSCIDLFFDRLLRRHPSFALGFFFVVTFAALNFFVPVLTHVKLHHGSYIAGVLSFLAAVPLAYPVRALRRPMVLARLALALLAVIGLVRIVRPLVPPVPLRLVRVSFTSTFDTSSMSVTNPLPQEVSAAAIPSGSLYAVATVFAPTNLPTEVKVFMYRNGTLLHSSGTVDITAHERGFRVWDSFPEPAGGFEPGTYAVELRTLAGQLLGRQSLHLTR